MEDATPTLPLVKLTPKAKAYTEWTTEEDEELKEECARGGTTLARIALGHNRSVGSIQTRIHTLGIKLPERMCPTCGQRVKNPKKAKRVRAPKVRVAKEPKQVVPGLERSHTKWTDAEDEELKLEHGSGLSQLVIAGLHKRSELAIAFRLAKHGLAEVPERHQL